MHLLHNIEKVINEIAHSEKVARCLGEIFTLAEPTECLNPQLPSETIPHSILNNAESTGKNERLLNRSRISPLVESPCSTQSVLSNNSEPTTMVQNELLKGDSQRLEKVSKAREKESSALSKLSSDKVANDLETQLGLPSETIISQKELESQVQELTQIIIDTARNFPRDTALLVYAYDELGENALANTLINTISVDKEVMQGVQKEFTNLIQQENEQSTQSVDEVAQTQQELDETQILQQSDDNAKMILGDEVNDGQKDHANE